MSRRPVGWTLARSIATAYLVAGDEDLREAVVYAQDVDVRVVLVGVEPVRNPNQADTLVREADQTLTFTRSELAMYLRSVEESTVVCKNLTPAEIMQYKKRFDRAGIIKRKVFNVRIGLKLVFSRGFALNMRYAYNLLKLRLTNPKREYISDVVQIT